MGSSDAFAAAIAAADLRRFRQVEHHVSIRSTNEIAHRRLDDPAAAGLVIVADEQTAGSGRRGRRWIAAPRSGLLFTAILPEPVAASAAWGVTFWTGICVADALQRWRIQPSLQWPNDILVGARKLCGILCVSRILGDRASVGCGVGVNVYRPRNRPELNDIVPPPLFLDDVAVTSDAAREELLVEILRQFESRLEWLQAPEITAREWDSRADLPARYRFALDEGAQIEGIAEGLEAGGGLRVRTERGERIIELAEYVRVVR